MAKTKKKTKRTYKCGSCGDLGHNSRKCPSKADPAATVAALAPPAPEAKETAEVTVQPPIAMSATQDVTSDHRKKDDRPARPAAPFECPSCLRCGILAIIQNEQDQKLVRCEYCYTKCRPKLILKWGALPEDKPDSF